MTEIKQHPSPENAELDQVQIAFGVATTQTEIDPERRWEAIKLVSEFLGKLRIRAQQMTDHTAWLVEINERFGPVYFQFVHDDDWTKDHDKAAHFSRKEDAERVIEHYGWTSAKAVEHMWPAFTSPRSRERDMTEKKMENPYYTLGEAFVASVVAGNRGKITGNQIGLSDRLREYAYFVQENAVEAGDAMLVNDLLDAARQLQRQAPAIQPQRASEHRDELAEWKQAAKVEAGLRREFYDKWMEAGAALNEVTTNGEWTKGDQCGEWKISKEVYSLAVDALSHTRPKCG